MKGQLPRALSLEEHKALRLSAAWYTFLPDQVLKASAWSFLQAFKKKGIRAWEEFIMANPDTPFTGGKKWSWDATGMTELSRLEAKYLAGRRRR
jgi:2,3-dimethylmalate lyase